MFQNAEGDVEEFAHEGATNGEVMEFAILQTGNPRLEGLRPTPSDGGRQVEGFAQEGVADFGEASFAIKPVARTGLCRG